MDFVPVPYSEEMEQFRLEVRSWLEANIPEAMKDPIDRRDRGEDRYWFWREKNKELAAKGWLHPIYPKQYGGGGLTISHEAILEEEFHRFRAPFNPRSNAYDALLVWGTEEQKQKFLRPLLTGEKASWWKLTEPHSGSDLASYESTAVRDGDEWVLNGSNAFPGSKENDVGWYIGPMKTDPEAPRHRNLGFFVIPYPSPGIEFRRMDLLIGDRQCFIFFDNVRVPADHLIGGDHQGWQVLATGLEQEHGGQGLVRWGTEWMTNLLAYMQEQRRKGLSPGGDPVLQQRAVDVYIENHFTSLFGRVTLWMYHAKTQKGYEGPLGSVHERESGMRSVARIRDVMGMYSLLGVGEPLAPHGGAQEVWQRGSYHLQHGAGSLNISRVIVARRIGISRTQERPAATPIMASSQHG